MPGVESVWESRAGGSRRQIPSGKKPFIEKAPPDGCYGLDGIKDGVGAHPPEWGFDPKDVECKAGDGPSCLTTQQVEAARMLYAGVTNPLRQKLIYPGLERGSELDWAFLALFKNPGVEHFK